MTDERDMTEEELAEAQRGWMLEALAAVRLCHAGDTPGLLSFINGCEHPRGVLLELTQVATANAAALARVTGHSYEDALDGLVEDVVEGRWP